VDSLARRVAARFQVRVAFDKALVALGVKELDQLSKKGRSFGVISAYRSNLSKHENQQRHGQLIADLQKLGIRKVEPLKSSWKDDATGVTHDEKSIFIPHITFETLHKLGKKYDQDAVLYKDPSGTVGIYHKDGTADMAYDPKGEAGISKSVDPGAEYSRGRGMSFGLTLVPEKFHYSGGPIKREEVEKKIAELEPESHGDKPEGGSSDWWDSQTPAAKKKYLEEHPDSAHAP
jgi:hypothetical protein